MTTKTGAKKYSARAAAENFVLDDMCIFWNYVGPLRIRLERALRRAYKAGFDAERQAVRRKDPVLRIIASRSTSTLKKRESK